MCNLVLNSVNSNTSLWWNASLNIKNVMMMLHLMSTMIVCNYEQPFGFPREKALNFGKKKICPQKMFQCEIALKSHVKRKTFSKHFQKHFPNEKFNWNSLYFIWILWNFSVTVYSNLNSFSDPISKIAKLYWYY